MDIPGKFPSGGGVMGSRVLACPFAGQAVQMGVICMQLTVRDVSRLLSVSEKTVYRWIKKEKIPAYRFNEHYRFDRDELMAWASSQKIRVSYELVAASGEDIAPLPALSDALEAGGIYYRVNGHDRASALRATVETVRLPEGVDRGFLLEVLLARESLASTGIGEGIAIPHVRNPSLLSTVHRAVVALCYLERPVEFGALDGEPVHTLFLLATPTVRSHLHLISRLMFCLRDASFRAAVLKRGLREEILASVREAEGCLSRPVACGQ